MAIVLESTRQIVEILFQRRRPFPYPQCPDSAGKTVMASANSLSFRTSDMDVAASTLTLKDNSRNFAKLDPCTQRSSVQAAVTFRSQPIATLTPKPGPPPSPPPPTRTQRACACGACPRPNPAPAPGHSWQPPPPVPPERQSARIHTASAAAPPHSPCARRRGTGTRRRATGCGGFRPPATRPSAC